MAGGANIPITAPVFSREGGSPTWVPAFAGKQCARGYHALDLTQIDFCHDIPLIDRRIPDGKRSNSGAR